MHMYLPHDLDLGTELFLFNDVNVHNTCRDRFFFFFPPAFPLFLISLKSWLGKHFKLRFKAIALKNVLRSHWLQCHYVQMSGWSLDFVLGKKKKKSSTQQQAVLHEHALKSAFMRFVQKVKWARSMML